MRFHRIHIPLLIALILSLPHCAQEPGAGIVYASSGHPAHAIVNEMVQGRARSIRILPPGFSPHVYDLKPTDIRKISSARAVIFINREMDGWVVRAGAAAEIELFSLLPQSFVIRENGAEDPHFWLDPVAVREILPELNDRLCALDPEGCPVYTANADRFSDRLGALDRRLEGLLRGKKGSVILSHPSLNYLLKRYGLRHAGSIEPFPGREPSLLHLNMLARRIKAEDVRAVLTEPQLPSGPAETLSEAVDLPLRLSDPYGGFPGRESYEEILDFNAKVLAEVLR
jgi:ABC-type Zn uptake system ZnuABC Zn-binding protein ZnuA